MIRRYSMRDRCEGKPFPNEPFVFVNRTFDIPKTIEGLIWALPVNCIAIGLNIRGGFQMIHRAERAARKRGMRIFWTRYGFD